MLAYGYIKENWQQAVDLYTRQCSIGVNARDLATMAATLAFMLPAMNADDRAELLRGMRASAPAEAFAGVLSLARSVLDPAEFAATAKRIDLD